MIRTRTALLALAALSATGAAPPAPAPAPASSSHDSDAPIDFDADRIEVQDAQHRAIWSGKVHAVQGEMTLTSDRATANYTGSYANAGAGSPQIQRLDATGNVVVTRPGETAKGNYAIYDLNSKLITMIGGVSLDRNGSVVHGGRLLLNLNTNQATVDGSAVGGNGQSGGGGRVSGRFIVPQHDANTTPAAAKPGAPATPATPPAQPATPPAKPAPKG